MAASDSDWEMVDGADSHSSIVSNGWEVLSGGDVMNSSDNESDVVETAYQLSLTLPTNTNDTAASTENSSDSSSVSDGEIFSAEAHVDSEISGAESATDDESHLPIGDVADRPQSSVPSQRQILKPRSHQVTTYQINTGAPGSKRFRRFVNTYYLRPRDDLEDPLETEGPYYSNGQSVLSQIHENPELRQLIQPMFTPPNLRASNSTLPVHLMRLPKQKASIPEAHSKRQYINRLDRKSRTILRKALESDILQELEAQLRSLVESTKTSKPKEETMLQFELKNSYHRLLCHSVAKYYNLHSTSFVQNGKSTVVVKTSRRSRSSELPPPLDDAFLQTTTRVRISKMEVA